MYNCHVYEEPSLISSSFSCSLRRQPAAGRGLPTIAKNGHPQQMHVEEIGRSQNEEMETNWLVLFRLHWGGHKQANIHFHICKFLPICASISWNNQKFDVLSLGQELDTLTRLHFVFIVSPLL